ncbi:hypothetical protein [Aeromicrobium sp. P5_D10]
MRAKAGWGASIVGVVVALLGAAIMAVLGPDSRFLAGTHPIETDAVAVVTAPKVISWANVRVDVLAEVPARKPIFVGMANSVDVENYVAKSQRLEITKFQRPWKLKTRSIDGTPSLPGAPTALDWWIASSAGLGGTSISADLPDETVSLAVLSVGSSNLSGLKVTVAYGVAGGFAKGGALLLLGLGLAWVGVLVRRGRLWNDDDWDDEDPADDELVVYVYLDEDGVEHEISAEEAADMDVVDEVVETEPADRDEQVVYVFVDDDGVEHEVSEAELADFEIVDEEEDRR